MGFFDKIKSAVSTVKKKVTDVKNKVDTKLGGFLPGGPTPSEVKASKPKEAGSPVFKPSETPTERGTVVGGDAQKPEVIREPTGTSRLTDRQREVAEESFFETIKRGATTPGAVEDLLSLASGGIIGGVKAGAGKGISKLATVTAGQIPTRGLGVAKEIGRINKFQKATKVTKAGEVGKFTKKGNVRTKFQTNPKTKEKTVSLLIKIARQFKRPSVIVTGIIGMAGTYPWAEWALGEAKEGMIFNTQKAINTGDIDILNEFIETSNEIFDMTTWETMRRLIPGLNLQFAFGEKAQALQAQWKVNNKIIEDEKIKIETGETEDDRWERIREEEAEMDKDAVDYYNDERQKMVEWEAEARRNQRNEDAAFWRSERSKQRVKEAEDRKAIADFWIEYRKTALKIREDSRPSNLNFGLL